ncbi:hypothetical protein LLEC1_00530 [Akanthomyces lecanii]|uniref:Uncharacterized protein n=1 Tax=Cordyceps confragosa TaxID=2714763 RepID=A0A179I7V5_CORDF|nr:hypothetical protein LLEC1_00530 [Akanthomyces lecanii]
MADARDKMYKYRQEISQVSRPGTSVGPNRSTVFLANGQRRGGRRDAGNEPCCASWRKPSASCKAVLGVTR